MSAATVTLKLAAVTAVTTLMLAAVVACGKKEDAGKSGAEKAGETSTTSAALAAKGSCNMTTELGTCNEYRGGSSFGLEKSLCEGFHGKFANSGCSTEGLIGSCLMSEGEVKRYYGSRVAGEHALSIEEAKGDCESDVVKGAFTVDPNAAAASAPVPEAPKPVGGEAKTGRPAAAKAGVPVKAALQKK
ncbi:MAG: hypothetical protein JWP87_3638 [Labilithrix sp.]|nr:hypothetical protein [Labilithrix sp.]